MNRLLTFFAFVPFALSGCGPGETESLESGDVPSGIYAVDQSHTYITFSYLHQGLSYPLLRATSADGELDYDANNISNSKVNISVAADSIRTNVDFFDKELASRKFFNAEKFPHMNFTTDSYSATSESEGLLSGHITIRGITEPLELAVTLNNALVHPMLDIPVIGFSATGSLSRSDFGLDRFVPVVSDTVAFNIEIEFLHGSNEGSAAAVARTLNESVER
jgi:polyisoprenoid-binding protein YceI